MEFGRFSMFSFTDLDSQTQSLSETFSVHHFCHLAHHQDLDSKHLKDFPCRISRSSFADASLLPSASHGRIHGFHITAAPRRTRVIHQGDQRTTDDAVTNALPQIEKHIVQAQSLMMLDVLRRI